MTLEYLPPLPINEYVGKQVSVNGINYSIICPYGDIGAHSFGYALRSGNTFYFGKILRESEFNEKQCKLYAELGNGDPSTNNYIVRCHGYALFELNGESSYIIVMDLATATFDFYCRVRFNDFNRLLVKFIKNLANILQCLRNKNYIHGDLKPENILAFKDEKGNVQLKLTDFEHIIEARPNPPKIRICVRYSRTYRPPEAIMLSYISPASDMWAVGCMLFSMLTHIDLFDIDEYRPFNRFDFDTRPKIPHRYDEYRITENYLTLLDYHHLQLCSEICDDYDVGYIREHPWLKKSVLIPSPNYMFDMKKVLQKYNCEDLLFPAHFEAVTKIITGCLKFIPEHRITPEEMLTIINSVSE